MARTLSVNNNNDIFAVGGTLQLADGVQAVLQTCERAVKANLGEMVLATDRGVNYFDDLWNGSPNVIRFEARARAQIARVPNVVAIERFNATIQNNSTTYTATIRTTFGAGEINGEL